MNLSPYLVAALAVATLAAIVFIAHRVFPSATVASVETAAKTEAAKLEAGVKAQLPDLEAEAMAAGQKFLTWLADTSSETAAIAKAQASIAKKAALRAQAAAALGAPTNPAA